ncbi:MAG: FMN-binding protein [Clostridia bacterium]|nr:FMN-binding protein [Clostridia bacterium]
MEQFIGKTLPVVIGEDVDVSTGATITSEAVIDALNELVAPITPQGIADYLFEHGELPDNFITKKEAQSLGWDSSYNYVSDVAPGKSIGGDRFGNYEELLPDKKGRTWYEADCYYTEGKRNAHRILFSSDGLVYYTDDHYESFTQMFPSN